MRYLKYLNVKNKVCFLYEGHNCEYLVLLKTFIPDIRSEFPDTEFTCACKSEYADYLNGKIPTISLDYYYTSKHDYGFTHKIVYDASRKQHPIQKLIAESNIKFNKIKEGKSKGNIAYISALGDFPNENLTEVQIDKAKSFARSKGFVSEVIRNKFSAADVRSIASKAAYVVGAANELFYEAVAQKTPTALIPTSIKAEEVYRFFSALPKVLPDK